jgi:phosphoribosyl 1,2-cyclic phosphate phosphodiesterase
VRLTFLGTGTSHGIPSIGCRCAVCLSADPRDRRTRCSALVQWGETHFLIDTPPELRLQAIRFDVRRVDALLLTHTHADHIMGLDDVRRYNEMQDRELPIFGRPDVLADVERVFRYVFVPTQAGGGKPRLRLIPLEGDALDFHNHRIEAIPVLHGQLEVTAFRFGPLAYVTDVSCIPPPSLERLRGLDTLVLGALRHEPHPTHFTVAQAVEIVEALAPRRAFFIHMSHGLSHRGTNAQLPPSVRLAYDGLVVEVGE